MAKKLDPKDRPSKTFDVSKPGETPADATSRPIIVNHSSMIKKDPMVRESSDEPDEKPETESKAPVQTHEIKIEPLKKEGKSEEDSTAEPEPEVSESKAETPAFKDEEVQEKSADPLQKPDDKPEDGKESGKKEGGGAVEALAGEVTAKREEQKQNEAAEAKAKEIEKIIESKEFFVPIKQTASRSALRFILIFISLIIVTIVVLNFAADAELINLGAEPLTDLL